MVSAQPIDPDPEEDDDYRVANPVSHGPALIFAVQILQERRQPPMERSAHSQGRRRPGTERLLDELANDLRRGTFST